MSDPKPSSTPADAARPNFLVVGAAKTGTTSVHAYLEQHPSVFMPTKENFFFISELYENNHLPYPAQRPKAEIEFSEAAYLAPYAEAAHFAARGEVATGYLYYHETAIPKIKRVLGEDIKLMAILRQPVDRIWSGYTFFTRDLHEKLPFEAAMAAEQERMEQDWDFMWHYAAHSLYADSVRAYQEAFPNFKVFFFDELMADPAAFMRSVFSFLDIDPNIALDLTEKNASGAPKSKAFQALVTQENPVKKALRPLIRAFAGREARHKMRQWLKAKNVGEKDRMTPEQYNALLPQFLDDITELEALTGRDLSHWKAPKA
jgi:hypothetical protein